MNWILTSNYRPTSKAIIFNLDFCFQNFYRYFCSNFFCETYKEREQFYRGDKMSIITKVNWITCCIQIAKSERLSRRRTKHVVVEKTSNFLKTRAYSTRDHKRKNIERKKEYIIKTYNTTTSLHYKHRVKLARECGERENSGKIRGIFLEREGEIGIEK